MDNSTRSTKPHNATANIGPDQGCRFCGGSLRRSRFRQVDLPRLLLLQWPVRCLSCSKRQHVSFIKAAKAISSRAPHAPEKLVEENWQHFTSVEPPVLRTGKSDEGNR